jgi:outer membrane protein OmpA-like peptidoglycan-associated protein
MRRISWFICAMLILVLPAQAAELDGRLGVGMEAAAMKLVGGERDYSDVNPNYALNIRYGISPHLSLEGALKALWARPAATIPGEEMGLEWTASRKLYTTFWQTRLGLLYHVLPEAKLSPYFGFGLGLSSFRVKDLTYKDDRGGFFPGGPIVEGYDEAGNLQELDAVHFTGTLTAGLEWMIRGNFALDLGLRYHLFPSNDLDNVGLSADSYVVGEGWGADHVDANTGMAELYLGLTWFFGSSDKDGDGILDKEDACPDAAEDMDGFQDDDGCPELDNDGDGIPDDRDRCPDAAEDMDGFQDDDGCPELDNDGDGIPDARDRCPDAAEDMDGFQDDDGCPELDNDGDGVADSADRCPGTPAGIAVDANGCPQVAEIKQALVLKGVNFLTGSEELTPESLSALADVARSLIAYPDVRVEIQGHTDSAGAAAFNESLSLKRAESVRDHIVTYGVDIRRLRAVGYGERFPIASNSNAEGRALNRRVEIHRIRD